MKPRHQQPSERRAKKGRATIWTDICRLLLCGIGCLALCASITSALDEEHEDALPGLVIVGVIGLAFILVGLFAKPKIAEEAAEGINF